MHGRCLTNCHNVDIEPRVGVLGVRDGGPRMPDVPHPGYSPTYVHALTGRWGLTGHVWTMSARHAAGMDLNWDFGIFLGLLPASQVRARGSDFEFAGAGGGA